MSTPSADVVCPSCGGPSVLTSYGPEPSLCVNCRRVFGVSPSPWAEPRARTTSSPDDPVWGSMAAVGLLVASLFAMLAAAFTAPIAYLAYLTALGRPVPFDALAGATRGEIGAELVMPSLSLQAIAQLVTLLVAWVVVTNGGQRGFFESIGWTWTERVRLPHIVALAITLQVFTFVFGQLVPEPKDMPFSKLLESSVAAKLVIAALAVATAPLVEEVVFRGVLYPALARPLGRIGSILVVSGIFLLIHFDQYSGAIGVMVPLGLLSVTLTALRAYTGSLLPSFALHTVFNGITVVFILLSTLRP